MTKPTLRAATEQDAATIVQVLHESFQEYVGILNPPSGVHKESVERVREKMKTAQWILAEMDGRVVGCVMAEPRDDYVYLGRLGVLPEYRGRGIGAALMNDVEARARTLHLTRVRLGVRVILSAMRAAYERRGYRFLRTMMHEGFPEPTYVLLEKTLE